MIVRDHNQTILNSWLLWFRNIEISVTTENNILAPF